MNPEAISNETKPDKESIERELEFCTERANFFLNKIDELQFELSQLGKDEPAEEVQLNAEVIDEQEPLPPIKFYPELSLKDQFKEFWSTHEAHVRNMQVAAVGTFGASGMGAGLIHDPKNFLVHLGF